MCAELVFIILVGIILLKDVKFTLFTTALNHYPFYSHLQKILEKLCELRKSCNHKRNINRIYNEKLHCNCLQQLPTLRLKTCGNSMPTKYLYPRHFRHWVDTMPTQEKKRLKRIRVKGNEKLKLEPCTQSSH